jgi:serine/threonine protein kinase
MKKEMIEIDFNRRPNCKQLLENSENWMIQINDIQDHEIYKSFENKYESCGQPQESFIHYLMNRLTSKDVNLYSDFFYLNEGKKFSADFDEIDHIALGSFGEVCKVSQKDDSKVFAVKRIAFSNHSHSYRPTVNELKMLTSLKSEYVVKYECAWIENNYFIDKDYEKHLSKKTSLSSDHSVLDPNKPFLLHIQMELCWKTIREAIKELYNELNLNLTERISRLGFFIICGLFTELLESVDFLHKQSPPIIHRDLKPANIMISYGLDDRFVKLADFGLATFHEYGEQSHTQGCGTIKYLAPEVMQTRKYSAKADIYSLGIIIQELFNYKINT